MMEFKEFRNLMQKHVTTMFETDLKLFIADVDKDELWDLYLDSFPMGTNEIFRERREHDCSCCKQFIRNFGNVVILKNNEPVSIWDFITNESTYQPVINALSSFIKKANVKDVFVTTDSAFGVEQTFEKFESGDIKSWDHFRVDLPKKYVTNSSSTVPSIIGEYREVKNVFKRSLEELTKASVEIVLELIYQKSLYKGDEWKYQLEKFLTLHIEYSKLNDKEKDNYCWAKSIEVGAALAKIKNHSIGVLLSDISKGMDLNEAVKRYESIVAPSNYKRPKAIFTTKMIEEAKKTMADLGLLDSMERRHATIEDVTVNNILFANKDAHKKMGDVFDDLAKDVIVSPKTFDKVEEVSIDTFVNDILPRAENIEVLFENKHASNLVSLIAPKNKESKSLFKWDNNFSWAYSGNITDSMKERVKAAGGRVDGALRFSHSWNHCGMRNASLMDLHVFMPGSTQHIEHIKGKEIHDNYGNNERVGWNSRSHYVSCGRQDVDYTIPAPDGYIPVENITFPDISRLKEGVYSFKIHNWKFRNPTVGGFTAEIAFGGQEYRFERKKALEHKEWVTVAKAELKNGEFRFLEMMENDFSSVDMWGIRTNKFHPVSIVMYSPNYWDAQDGIGHRHFFFIINDCKNDESPNGFFNEFLPEDLMKHKRVFEALGGKMKVEPSEEQVSGIGFSSTKRNSVVCKVTGNFTRIIKINF